MIKVLTHYQIKDEMVKVLTHYQIKDKMIRPNQSKVKQNQEKPFRNQKEINPQKKIRGSRLARTSKIL